jgi:two-component system, chemotaxis family, CheB/CheR fusion protein
MAKPEGRSAKRTPQPHEELDVDVASPAVDTHSTSGFPVVGVGASAGGLAAFEAFFSGMPAGADPGMAFVLVQHLAPDHKSILTDLVQRYTRMHVVEVEDGIQVLPNHTYIIPPNRDMALLNGTLQLLEPSAPRGLRLPIDFFFRSLAQDQRERAIGIVLSGTGSDGTQGVRAIKGEGGMVMAQTPESTEYDGMPRSAISTGLVDYELPPAEMANRLIAYVSRAYGQAQYLPSVPAPRVENALKKVHVLLRGHTGHDFSEYKPSTVNRRIERRLAVNQIETIDEYVLFARQTPLEVEALFRDLLIGVTSFFRDAAAFKALDEQVLPEIFTRKPSGATIRVWSPGCSTGEEAYSLAMLLQEGAEALKEGRKVQVFATDIDSRALAIARAGVYAADIALDVSPARLARFFAPEVGGDGYRVKKGIRDLLVFSEQDVAKDPPFSKLDLISCRNLLIYMGAELQRRLLPLFHYALNPGGYLFLGASETVGESGDLFSVVDRRAKIYQRKDAFRPGPRYFPSPVIPLVMSTSVASPRAAGRIVGLGKLPLRELTEQTLLQESGRAAVLVNEQGDILYVHGRTGAYLEPAPGEADVNNILRMAREGLRRDLTNALHKAVGGKETVRRESVRVRSNGGFITADLTIRPVPVASPADRLAETDAPPEASLFLVLLDEVRPPVAEAVIDTMPERPSSGAPGVDLEAEARIAALRQELRAKEEYLQTTNEELETSNEELRSSNEEMQSLNEELQSINEELETSKEELQSINEELATVNSELETKVTDLSRANNDLNNLLAGTGVGTVFVDYQMRIMRFTPAVTNAINLIPGDVGRPVGHIASNLVGYTRIVADTREVLDTLIPKEVEVETAEGTWYAMRILPYRTLENAIEGAVITFVDITEMKRAVRALSQAEAAQRLALVVRDARDVLTVHDLEGRIVAWNPMAEKMYGWTEAEALALNARDLVPEEDRAKALVKARRLADAQVLRPYRARRVTKAGVIIEVMLIATALVNEAGVAYAVATTERRVEPSTRGRNG